MNLLLQYLITFTVVIPIVIGSRGRVFRDKQFLPVYGLLFLSLTIEMVNVILAFKNINTTLVFNMFSIAEFVLIWSFYKSFINQINKTIINSVVLYMFLAIAFIDLFFVNGFKRLNNITVSVESITLIIYSLISFYLIMNRMLFDKILEEPFFWINIAVLFYFSGSLFLFLFGNYLINQGNKAYMEMYKIHTFVNAVWYFFISIGFWKVKKA